jgi:hypothetical protein
MKPSLSTIDSILWKFNYTLGHLPYYGSSLCFRNDDPCWSFGLKVGVIVHQMFKHESTLKCKCFCYNSPFYKI